MADLAATNAKIADLQTALSSAQAELAAARASAAAKQVRWASQLWLACQQARGSELIAAVRCLQSQPRQKLTWACSNGKEEARSQADTQAAAAAAALQEAQQQGEAQSRRLRSEIERLEAAQAEAATGSSRQVEALQVCDLHTCMKACML